MVRSPIETNRVFSRSAAARQPNDEDATLHKRKRFMMSVSQVSTIIVKLSCGGLSIAGENPKTSI